LQQFFCKMTDQKAQEYMVFGDKFKALLADYQKLKAENRLLSEKADAARNQLKIAHKEFVELQKEYHNFRLAKLLTGECTEEEKAEKKQKIEKMVREIDTCLKLLKD